MRSITYCFLVILGLSLIALFTYSQSLLFLGFAAVIITIAALLALTNTSQSILLLGLLTAAIVGGLGVTFAQETLWLNGLLAYTIGIIATSSTLFLLSRMWHRRIHLLPGEMMVLRNQITEEHTTIYGPAWILPTPVSKPFVMLPLLPFSQDLVLLDVDTMPHDGLEPNGIARVVVRVRFQMRPDNYKHIFLADNQQANFQRAVSDMKNAVPTIKKATAPRAFLNTTFWEHCWWQEIRRMNEDITRKVLHASGKTALEIHRERQSLSIKVLRDLKESAQQIGLEILNFSIQQVHLYDSDALLQGRTSELLAQGEAERVELVGEAALNLGQRMSEGRGGYPAYQLAEVAIEGQQPRQILKARFRSDDTYAEYAAILARRSN